MFAKFRIEPGPAVLVVRERLLDRLATAVHGPLTYLAAEAGAGKTALVGSWARMGLSPGATTWITLDDGDRQPGVFWSYFLEGLTRSGVSVSGVSAPLTRRDLDQSFLVRLSAELFRRTEPVVVLLDNAEVLAGSVVLNQLDFLLRHSGPQLRLVLISRLHHLGSALHRHRLDGSLTEIGSHELSFTGPEARLLLREHGVSLSDEALNSLMGRTRGWAAGLALAAISMRPPHDAERALASFTGDRGDLADYLATEVLDPQPAPIRRFLLRTSIATHLRPGLADEVTGRHDSARILDALARANSFLESCPEHEECYCYHPLLLELLRAQLSDTAPGAVGQLHRVASAWYAAGGSLEDAVRHAAAAGDWGAVASLLVDDLYVVRLLTGTEAAYLAPVLGRIPVDAASPEAAVVLAVLALRGSDFGSCVGHLSRARETVGDGPLEQATALALAISLVELVLACARADLDAAISAAATVEGVLDGLAADGVAAPPGTRAFVLLCLARTQFAAGHPEAASTTAGTALRAAKGAGSEHVRLRCLGLLALVEAVRGRLAHAAELGRAAETLADQCGISPAHLPQTVAVAMAWVHAESCDTSSARLYADRADTADAVHSDPVAAALLALVRAGLLRTAGDLDGALATIDRARTARSQGRLPAWLDERLRAATAAVQLAAGRPDAAVLATEGADGSAAAEIAMERARVQFARGDVSRAGEATTELLRRPDLPIGVRVDGWLLQASCAVERGAAVQARAALDQAFRLAEPERMRRPIVEAPPRLRSLIRHSAEITARHPWLGSSSAGAGTSGRAAPASRFTLREPAQPVLVEPLTAKEQEVLHHLAALMSTEEIATAMFVSVNTVKTHVRGILRKLAASRRNEAIRRARELELI
ncbi:MAG TPA: LuxR C-terminal-related transcriptional regulator [Mycobacteriales bacterium]